MTGAMDVAVPTKTKTGVLAYDPSVTKCSKITLNTQVETKNQAQLLTFLHEQFYRAQSKNQTISIVLKMCYVQEICTFI